MLTMSRVLYVPLFSAGVPAPKRVRDNPTEAPPRKPGNAPRAVGHGMRAEVSRPKPALTRLSPSKNDNFAELVDPPTRQLPALEAGIRGRRFRWVVTSSFWRGHT